MARIPGCENVEADKQSELCLKKTLFTNACSKLNVAPNIGLFASRIDCQITPYVSYRADPEAFAINAFHMSWQPYLFYAFPPFILSSPKDSRRAGNRAPTCAKMANSTVVAQVNADVNTITNTAPKGQGHSVSTQQPTGTSPTSQETVSDSMSLVRRYLNGKGLSTTAATVMEQSWRSGTRKQYATYLQKWRRYCSSRCIDPICPSVEDGINFLAELYDSGIGYSAINTARSAVSSIITLSNNISFGAHPMVCHFLKGVFELKPSLPKYKNIWDVNTVLTYLSRLHPPQDLNLKDLTYKTTMLLALLSGQRCQTLYLLSVCSMVLKHDSCVFPIHKLLKTSGPGKHLFELQRLPITRDLSPSKESDKVAFWWTSMKEKPLKLF